MADKKKKWMKAADAAKAAEAAKGAEDKGMKKPSGKSMRAKLYGSKE